MRRRGRTGGNELNVEKRNWDGTFGRTRERRETEGSVDERERAEGSWNERETDG